MPRGGGLAWIPAPVWAGPAPQMQLPCCLGLREAGREGGGREPGCPSRPPGSDHPRAPASLLVAMVVTQTQLSIFTLPRGSFVSFKKSPCLWEQCRLHLESQGTLRAPTMACREGPRPHGGGR